MQETHAVIDDLFANFLNSIPQLTKFVLLLALSHVLEGLLVLTFLGNGQDRLLIRIHEEPVAFLKIKLLPNIAVC